MTIFIDYCNTDARLNGEKKLFDILNKHCDVVFDIGSASDSIFLEYDKIVHYFEPDTHVLEVLKSKTNHNLKSVFNNFGLGDSPGIFPYYDNIQSFVNREIAPSHTHSVFSGNMFRIETGSSYLEDNNLTDTVIDFIKIDVECMELQVLRGFDPYLSNVKYIQFEHGIGTSDNGSTLKEIIGFLSHIGFIEYSVITPGRLLPIDNVEDHEHHHYCNIICRNSKMDGQTLVDLF